MLLSKLEAENKKKQKRGGQKWNNFRSKSKGAIMFVILEMIVFLFLIFGACRCVSLKRLSNNMFRRFGALFFV